MMSDIRCTAIIPRAFWEIGAQAGGQRRSVNITNNPTKGANHLHFDTFCRLGLCFDVKERDATFRDT